MTPKLANRILQHAYEKRLASEPGSLAERRARVMLVCIGYGAGLKATSRALKQLA